MSYFDSIPETLVDTFAQGVDRYAALSEWEDYHHNEGERLVVNLGAGKKTIRGAHDVDFPAWKAGQSLPFEDGSVDLILAYHFFEHLNKIEILNVLWEVERVLKKGRCMNVVTPHWDSEAAHQDLDHKSFWSESTWRNLFENPYYEGTMPRAWKLRERVTVIMGMVQRNLCIVSQIQRSYA